MAHKILVLDDDIHVRGSLVSHLDDEGFEVSEVSSSEDALALLEDMSMDLVIVDLRLPGIDGTQFIHAAEKKWPGLKYIVYTGSPEFRIPAELASMDCVSNSIFLKPLPDCSVMTAEIRRMLGQGN